MGKRTNKQVNKNHVLSLMLICAVTLSFGGCNDSGGGGSDYTIPVVLSSTQLAGQSSTTLIDSATLSGWNDYINLETSFESNVIILDVTTTDNYLAGHIPGAQLWNINEQFMNRHEGVAEGVNMVIDGVSMDAMIQKHGIDYNTTIVLTTSLPGSNAPTAQVGRAYFLFRYWGWNKDRLKVLNGFNNAWVNAGNSLVEEVPEITASTYTVKSNFDLHQDQRASLDEMITAVDNNLGVPLDVRTSSAGPSIVSDRNTDDTSDDIYTVFEGQIAGSQTYPFFNFTNNDMTFLDSATIAEAMNNLGIDGSSTVYPYCTTGVLASAGYFVLDAILGWDAMLYDGSWSQWGQMSDFADKGGMLSGGSTLNTDDASLSTISSYNVDSGLDVTLIFTTDSSAVDPEEADATYMSEADSGGDSLALGPGYGG